MKITLDTQHIEIDEDDNGKSNGGDVRAKLTGKRHDYQLWREHKPDDQLISDTTDVFAGDALYAIPPCMNA